MPKDSRAGFGVFLRTVGNRGGTRGGQSEFKWDDVKADASRENYLGHSVHASVGRWQKGRDLTWFTSKLGSGPRPPPSLHLLAS